MGTRVSVAAVLGTFGLLAAGSVSASTPTVRAAPAGATASALGIQVSVPGQAGDAAASVSAPPDTFAPPGGFSYAGTEGTAVTATATASAATVVGDDATATASAQVTSLSLFGGEVTVASVTARARGSTRGRTATGTVSDLQVSGITVLGQAASGGRIALGDWGYATIGAQASSPSSSGGVQSYRGSATALDIHLTAPHGGLPAGTQIQVGHVEIWVQGSSTPKAQKPKQVRKKAPARAHRRPRRAEPPSTSSPAAPIRPVPPNITVRLTAGGYVFPVYGPSSFTNTFGYPRAHVKWHHGEDIFAPLGAPVLAVADGEVFSVGWNDIGGNRLWLRDGQGNEFYYAHLSAFSPEAKNGNQVKAGDVLGFVGNTGDAEGTPYHLHFEIHPVALLYMGYDGVIEPYDLLVRWKKLQDVRFTAAAGWVAAPTTSSPAPKPGAVLLHASDISEASGLDPAALRRAFVTSVSHENDGALIRAAHLSAPAGPRS